MVEGPHRALPILQRLQGSGTLENYFPFYAAQADLLRRAGYLPEAAKAYAEAIARCHTHSERRYLEKRRQQILAAEGASCLAGS
jgi:RNA polymerase sigma-70 factor (ECF subfamily)